MAQVFSDAGGLGFFSSNYLQVTFWRVLGVSLFRWV